MAGIVVGLNKGHVVEKLAKAPRRGNRAGVSKFVDKRWIGIWLVCG